MHPGRPQAQRVGGGLGTLRARSPLSRSTRRSPVCRQLGGIRAVSRPESGPPIRPGRRTTGRWHGCRARRTNCFGMVRVWPTRIPRASVSRPRCGPDVGPKIGRGAARVGRSGRVAGHEDPGHRYAAGVHQRRLCLPQRGEDPSHRGQLERAVVPDCGDPEADLVEVGDEYHRRLALPSVSQRLPAVSVSVWAQPGSSRCTVSPHRLLHAGHAIALHQRGQYPRHLAAGLSGERSAPESRWGRPTTSNGPQPSLAAPDPADQCLPQRVGIGHGDRLDRGPGISDRE